MTPHAAHPKITENDVKKVILDYLLRNKILAWRNNTGAFVNEYKGKKRFHRFGKKGSGDIFGLFKGNFLSVETKKPGESPTEDQWKFITDINANGGYAWWFDNFEDFELWFKTIGKR